MAEERDDKKTGKDMGERRDNNSFGEVGEENIQQRLKECTRKRPIWREISTYLNASGYDDRDCDSCKTRIHTLISAYRGYKDALSRSGNTTPKKKAPFFDEILSDKPSRPVIVLSSTVLESAQSEETEVTDGEKSPQPSCSFPTLEKEKRKKADLKHLPSLLGRFVTVSVLTRKCYVVCHLTNLLCNKRHVKKHDKMGPLLIRTFAKSIVHFNVVLYSIHHLKPQVTDH